MAKGRMLKKAICESRRVMNLKNDTNRLLYTWLIPHLDVEGRMHADPELFKGKVAPRLKHVTPKKIEDALLDMGDNELILLYEVDGDKYLELRNFHKHNAVRKDREGESLIPPPGELPENSRTTPAQVKLSKVNISKDKKPSGAPYILPTTESIQESSEPKTYDDIDTLCNQLVDGKIFSEAFKFKQQKVNFHFNPRAILHALSRCYLSNPKPDDPWAYCEDIIKDEDGNYNARESEKIGR